MFQVKLWLVCVAALWSLVSQDNLLISSIFFYEKRIFICKCFRKGALILIFLLQVREHPIFRREGNHVHVDAVLSMAHVNSLTIVALPFVVFTDLNSLSKCIMQITSFFLENKYSNYVFCPCVTNSPPTMHRYFAQSSYQYHQTYLILLGH